MGVDHVGAGPGSIEPQGIFDGLQWRAIVFGVVVDTLLTMVVSMPLLYLFAGPEVFADDEAVARAAEARAYASDAFNVVMLLAGLACTLVGGGVGAARAGLDFVRHGGWVGVGSLLLGVALLTILPAGPHQPLWVEVLGLVLIVPAGALGGRLAAALRDAAR